MALAPEPQDDRIDLDGVDVLRAVRSAAATSVPEPAPRISTFSNESPNTVYGHW